MQSYAVCIACVKFRKEEGYGEEALCSDCGYEEFQRMEEAKMWEERLREYKEERDGLYNKFSHDLKGLVNRWSGTVWEDFVYKMKDELEKERPAMNYEEEEEMRKRHKGWDDYSEEAKDMIKTWTKAGAFDRKPLKSLQVIHEASEESPRVEDDLYSHYCYSMWYDSEDEERADYDDMRLDTDKWPIWDGPSPSYDFEEDDGRPASPEGIPKKEFDFESWPNYIH